MNWWLVAAILLAGFLGTFTDWLFMGVLFHDRYMRYPEVWWPSISDKTGDRRAIMLSSAVSFLTAAGVIALCAYTGTNTIMGGLIVAILVWVAGSLVVTLTSGFWIKTDPMITLMQALGHLARTLIAGAAGALTVQWVG